MWTNSVDKNYQNVCIADYPSSILKIFYFGSILTILLILYPLPKAMIFVSNDLYFLSVQVVNIKNTVCAC